jgi:DNA-binding transcriptional MocR family regulator
MPRRTATLELMLPLRGPAASAHHWLCTALRAEILNGRLRAGARLPSTRDLAQQYGLSRGTIVTAFDQVAMVSGAQEALDLVTRLFVAPGDRVCIEEPGYVGAALVFEAAGARVVRVSVDADGWTVCWRSPASKPVCRARRGSAPRSTARPWRERRPTATST